MGRLRIGRALHALPRASLGGGLRRRRALGTRARDSRRGALAGSRTRAAPVGAPCPTVVARVGGATRRRGRRDRPGWRGARPARADDRLCPPLRHLQARNVALRGGRPRQEAALGPRTSGAAGLRRQGASARPGRQRADSFDHPLEPRRRTARARRLPRGLRHSHRTDTGQRRGRLAEYPSTPPRGQRHERDEGRDERRAQCQRSRRMVRRSVG